MEIVLPDPWRQVRVVTGDERDIFEASAGSRLVYADLTDDDVSREGPGTFPRSARAYYVMGHRWVELQNVDTDSTVYVRLQLAHADGDPSVRITAVVFPFVAGHDLSGADLRSLPVAALNAAFTNAENDGKARLARTFALGQDPPEPLEPLPPADASDRFAALVARQYLALEEEGRGNVARRLAELNDSPLPSAQRWIARARKFGFLPPATPRSGRD